jgi:hypothetical protein
MLIEENKEQPAEQKVTGEKKRKQTTLFEMVRQPGIVTLFKIGKESKSEYGWVWCIVEQTKTRTELHFAASGRT